MRHEQAAEGNLRRIIVHQHHHYGWSTREHEAASKEDAMLADIMHDHPWLEDYDYEISFSSGRYAVTYQGPTRLLPLGQRQYTGDHWFGDQIRIGEHGDCPSCGGTGKNHYYSWRQCWACGDQNEEGKSSGKKAAA